MTKNKTIFLLLVIHAIVILLILTGLILTGIDYKELILRDDGYYNIAKNFVHGDSSLFHKFREPLLPLIFSILFIFPDSLHPFIRLLITLIFSLGVIIITYKITKDYLKIKQFFWGSLLFILNPVYIHWTFKSAPEIYLCFLLGLFIYNILRYIKTKKIGYILCALLSFFLSFFIKPVFLFIPILMFIFGLIFIKSKKIIIVSIICLILGFVGYKTQDRITKINYGLNIPKIERKYDYVHKVFLISQSYWTDYVVKTKQLRFSFINKYTIAYKDDKSLEEYTKGWIDDFYKKYPDKGLIFMNLYFIYKEPLLVLQKLILSPFFYFSMSSRTYETFIKLFVSIVSLILSIIGIKKIFNVIKWQGRKEILLILSIVLGYIILHLVSGCHNRYSLPVLPYLYVWGGVTFLRFKSKKKNVDSQFLYE